MVARTPSLAALARHPRFRGLGDLTLVARTPFWDEDGLPFTLHGGGSIVRLEPSPGLSKDALAATPDERLLVVDCPDAPGWLVPAGIVAGWLQRNVRNDALDDLLLAHPLYEHLTRLDRDGRSRGGRQPLAQWVPGIPTLAHVVAPEFLPDDHDAPAVNRDPDAYAAAALGLLGDLEANFDLVEVELAVRLGSPSAP